MGIIYEGSILHPDLVSHESLSRLLGGLGYENGKFSFGTADFEVAVEGQNLIVSCIGNPHKEIHYLKNFILMALRRHETAYLSDQELAARLVEITHSDELLLSTVNAAFFSAGQQYTDAPEEYWRKFEQDFRENIDQWIATIASVYNKYYTREELVELIEFYQSDLGKKTLEIMPNIGQEITQVVRAWIETYLSKMRN